VGHRTWMRWCRKASGRLWQPWARVGAIGTEQEVRGPQNELPAVVFKQFWAGSFDMASFCDRSTLSSKVCFFTEAQPGAVGPRLLSMQLCPPTILQAKAHWSIGAAPLPLSAFSLSTCSWIASRKSATLKPCWYGRAGGRCRWVEN